MNMVLLNKRLHCWWGEAYFAFKCLGIVDGEEDGEKQVKIQFH